MIGGRALITHDVKLCIGGDNSKMRLVVKCHDTGVNLRVYLVTCRHSKWREINEPYYIPADSTAVLKIAKPDNTFVLADGLIESDDILFELPPQAFTVAGVSEAEVSLFGADGRKVTSDTFNIDVSEECVCDGHEESETYVDIMAQQILAAIDAAKRAEEAAKRAEEAEGDGGVDAEALKEAIDKALDEAKASGEFDGEDGDDGITPHIGSNGNWYTGETDTGVKAQGEPGKDGAPGASGKDGYTPQKGVDYFDGRDGKDGYTPVKGIDYFDGQPGKDGADGKDGSDGAPGKDGKDGDDYVLTEADKTEIAEQAAQLVDVPTDDHINSLINTALGVIENGTY